MPVRRAEALWRSFLERAEQVAQLRDHVGRAFDAVGRAHQQVERPEDLLLHAERLADAPLDSVAIDSVRGVLSRYQHAEAGAPGLAPLQIESVSSEAAPRALAKQPLKIRLPPQPAPGVEPEALAGRG